MLGVSCRSLSWECLVLLLFYFYYIFLSTRQHKASRLEIIKYWRNYNDCGGLLDIVRIKRIGESQYVSSMNGYGDPLKEVHCFLRMRILCWSTANSLYQLHCLIVPRSDSFNGDRIEDMCGVQILIFEGRHSCGMFSCASAINGFWLDVRRRIRIGKGDVPHHCFAP